MKFLFLLALAILGQPVHAGEFTLLIYEKPVRMCKFAMVNAAFKTARMPTPKNIWAAISSSKSLIWTTLWNGRRVART